MTQAGTEDDRYPKVCPAMGRDMVGQFFHDTSLI